MEVEDLRYQNTFVRYDDLNALDYFQRLACDKCAQKCALN
jgi:hypothetical protein